MLPRKITLSKNHNLPGKKKLLIDNQKLTTHLPSSKTSTKSSQQQQIQEMQSLKKASKLEKRRLRAASSKPTTTSPAPNPKLSSPLPIRTPTKAQTLKDINTAAELQIRAELERASQDPTGQEESPLPEEADADAGSGDDATEGEAKVALKARVGPSKRHLRYRQRRKAWREKHRERNAQVLREAAGVALPA